MKFFHLSPKQKLITIAIIFVISWIIGTLMIHRFEQAQHWSYFDAFYFNVITTATIGFGDLTPHSVEGKIITMIYAIFYVPLFLYSMSLIFESNLRKMYRHQHELEEKIHETEADVAAILENRNEK